MKNWMIYGANGYSGEMIAREALKRGMTPILAGRNSSAIRNLGSELGLPIQVFDCADAAKFTEQLQNIDILLNCAGPFSATSREIGKACIKAKTNYLDITGEIAVFEGIFYNQKKYADAGIVAIPGVGFDVVPSDCLAALLKQKMSDATDLELTLKPEGGLSPGTTKTMVEGFIGGSVVRKSGKLKIEKELFFKDVLFAGTKRHTMSIPWGDVSTAFYSTDIPNIRVLLVTPRTTVKKLQFISKFKWLTQQKAFQFLAKEAITHFVKGPDADQLNSTKCQIWGSVTNAAGRCESMGLTTPMVIC